MATGLFTLKQVNQAVRQTAWTTGVKTTAVDYLVVAGGGGAGASSPAGGGAGGLLQGSVPVVTGSAITVTVGAGGAGQSGSTVPGSGTASVFGSISTAGGGYGATSSTRGGSGGSGGGAGTATDSVFGQIGQGTANQGNPGGIGSTSAGGQTGGGGGAGTRGGYNSNGAGDGGTGVASVIRGTVTAYAGGGGGYGSGTSGRGGAGGGGAGAIGTDGTSGTANTGGGGGGAQNYTGGSGGSGIVIVSYPDVYAAASATTGSPTVSTSGSGSVSFNGTNQGFVYTDNAGLALGTGDFTVECFVYPGSQPGGTATFIGGEAAGAFMLSFEGAGTPTSLAVNAYGTGPFFSQSYAFSQNVWYHIACTRNGTSVRVYVNGTQLGSTTTNSTNFSAGTRSIGEISGGTAQRYAGNVSNVRIVKGTALYTGSTLTVPTAPLTAVSGTSLLLNTVSGAYTADSSTNSLVVSTLYGTPTWTATSPFSVTGYKNRVYTWTSSGSITF